MTDKEILELSRKTKKSAIQIIKEHNIIEVLSAFGEPTIIGSFELDLMIDEDIDIIVKTDSLKANAKNALNELIDLEIANKYEFGDFITFTKENRPRGYIVSVKLNQNGRNWEIEIWFLKDSESYLKRIAEYKSKLDDKKRMTILKKKYERKMLGQTKQELSSTEIYDEILK